MKDWLHWAQAAQHEWWFIPAGLGCLIVLFGVAFGVRIAYTRFMGWAMSPRMRMTDDQVEAQWATAADLEKFGLIKPKKGLRAWIAR